MAERGHNTIIPISGTNVYFNPLGVASFSSWARYDYIFVTR